MLSHPPTHTHFHSSSPAQQPKNRQNSVIMLASAIHFGILNFLYQNIDFKVFPTKSSNAFNILKKLISITFDKIGRKLEPLIRTRVNS